MGGGGGLGCLRSDQRGLTPNCKNGDWRRDLRDDDRGDFVGDDGLGLVVVDVERLKGAHAERLPAVGHSVHMDALQRGRHGNGLRCCAGSCTHAPQAAVNDMDSGAQKQEAKTHTHSHTCRQSDSTWRRRRSKARVNIYSVEVSQVHSQVKTVHIYPRQVSNHKIWL